ncbi:MAG: hypothetical protein J7K82_02585 [Thermoproteales archaeon]|nr:hypothetical protein [Thermoproteales archaeon]
MKVISIRDKTYVKLKKVKNILRAESFGEAIEKLIEAFYEKRRRYFLELIEKTKLPEEEVEKVEKAIKKIEEREWW